MSKKEIIEEYKNIIYSVRDEKINLNDELNRENIYHTLWRFLDLYQKEKEKNEKIKAQIEKRISHCECEKLEATKGIYDDHYKYWDCFKDILERLLQELLQEGDK